MASTEFWRKLLNAVVSCHMFLWHRKEGREGGRGSCSASENLCLFISPGPKSVFVLLIGECGSKCSLLLLGDREGDRASEFERRRGLRRRVPGPGIII